MNFVHKIHTRIEVLYREILVCLLDASQEYVFRPMFLHFLHPGMDHMFCYYLCQQLYKLEQDLQIQKMIPVIRP